jgi:hypothetical protein
MTANIKIPVASADNVTAVPLAAVFTEKNPDSGLPERFVYVQQGDSVERRNVKVGVSDYFFAEIQGGLQPGEVVCLELPKEEREKKARELANERRPRGETGTRLGTIPPPAAGTTNVTAAPGSSPSETPGGGRRGRRGPRGPGGGGGPS